MKIGDRMKDNDPRMGNRVLVITEILPNGVAAKDSIGRVRLYLRKHIHTDGKPRRGGFTLEPPPCPTTCKHALEGITPLRCAAGCRHSTHLQGAQDNK
jgi:hypothetical protein